MAAARKRPAAGKPAAGSVEDLRRRAAALREEADRLLATEAVDPVFGLIEAHRAAFEAWSRSAHAWNHMDPRDPRYEAAEATAAEPGRREQEAFLTLLAARPTTVAGLWALTAYLPEAMRKASPDPTSQEQAALDVLREGALRLGLAQPGRPTEPSPDADLIRACDEAVCIAAAINAPDSSFQDDENQARMKDIERLVEFAIATPATTLAGMAGKARILKNEWPCNAHREDMLDNGDHLIRSLIWDLAGRGARA